jgi:S-adenosylmethionine synthetase
MSEIRLFTSESVTEGHPDKLADQISDAVLDELLKQDPKARVALETFLTRGLAVVGGELTTSAYVEIADVVRNTIIEVGYTHTDYMGVDRDKPEDQGAGDQGMMFGYACDETEQLMPLPITIAHALTRRYTEVRKSRPELGFRPDGKSQVTIAYRNGQPSHIDTIVFSAQHEPTIENDVRARVMEHVIRPVLTEYAQFAEKEIKTHINPTGRFVIGGPQGDTGVTGRKIIVDTYGGYARHGGGAFSGKDPSKVDRSAAYVARYLAKNVVAAGLAKRCEIQLAYAIGVAEPVSIYVDTFDTGKISENEIVSRLKEAVDLRPYFIIEKLGLLDCQRISYLQTAKNGHFGNPNFPWEKTDLVNQIA